MSYPTATECAAILADAAKMRRWMGDIGAGVTAAPGTYTDEQVRDVMGVALVAGANTTITVNDPADTITIASTGGSATSPLTTKGDLWGFSSVDARLPAGADARLLQADAAQTLGLRYAAMSGDATIALGGALTLATVNTNTGALGDGINALTLTTNAKGLATAVTTTPLEVYAAQSQASAATCDYTTARVHKLTLTGNVTLTLSGATNGVACALSIYFLQDGTGSRLITWPGSVKWPLGATPVLSTAAASLDLFIFESFDGGTTWYGNVVGKKFA